ASDLHGAVLPRATPPRVVLPRVVLRRATPPSTGPHGPYCRRRAAMTSDRAGLDVEELLQELAGVALLDGSDVLRRADGDDGTAARAALRAEVDHPVG